ncbi:DUF956 family protein [Lacticaseibacillus zhaodongensis]|uniref:DUF956 family protein n=1 Tax=Lacticaseibacillus zhaodongensis TaxID=2668065 RepID=UPI0012D2E8C9|nr:DUF956 family protein [Lacticaseibacillus zhaodongensis]
MVKVAPKAMQTVESMNTKVDLTEEGTAYTGLDSYGKIMIGNKAFEFYNDRKNDDYIQIPWTQVDYVIVSVLFGGRRIPRFAVRTKSGVDYSFSSRHPHTLLRAIRKYVPADHIVKSLSFFQVIRNGIKKLWQRLTHSNKKN